MMENRSFDHFLGWLPGADGRQAGLTYLDTHGRRAPDPSARPRLPGLRLQRPGPLLRGRAASSTTAAAATAGSAPARTTTSASATTRRTTCRSYGARRAATGRSATATSRRSSARRIPTASTCTPARPTASQHAARRRSSCRRSGTGSPRARRQRPLLLQRPPVPRALGLEYLDDHHAVRGLPRATAATGTLPAVSYVDPRFLARPVSAARHRRPSARRHPRRRGFLVAGLQRRHVEPGLAEHAARHHLRRVGRLLRPRRRRRVRRTTQPAATRCAASGCRPCSSRRSRGAATSTTASTTTRRSSS